MRVPTGFGYTDNGTLVIDSYRPGEHISGRFETEAADGEDGDGAGEIAISFRADRCNDYENLYLD